MRRRLISGISPGFPELSRSQGQVTHVLLTRSPLIHPASWASPFDLHVLSTPPAFVLSQDQTLRKRETSTPTEVSVNNDTGQTNLMIKICPKQPPLIMRPVQPDGQQGHTRKG